MPLPIPRQGQTKEKFMALCMANETMVKEYPQAAQRMAVCQSQWARKGAKNARPDRA